MAGRARSGTTRSSHPIYLAAFPRESGRTDGDGFVTLVMPTVDVSLDLSIDHRERDDGPIEQLIVGK